MLMTTHSVTAVIVAGNDEKTIPYLIRSLVSQSTSYVSLDRIIIICNGSSDHTASKVARYAKKYPRIQAIYHQEALPVPHRINEVAPFITSNLTLIVRPDAVLKGTNFLYHLSSRFFAPTIAIAAPMYIPVTASGFAPYLIRSHMAVRQLRLDYVEGKDDIRRMSSATIAVRTEFLKNSTIPDEANYASYLYRAAKYAGHHIFFCERSSVYYNTINDFTTLRLLNDEQQSSTSQIGLISPTEQTLVQQLLYTAKSIWFYISHTSMLFTEVLFFIGYHSYLLGHIAGNIRGLFTFPVKSRRAYAGSNQ